jgi:hypothetical protein
VVGGHAHSPSPSPHSLTPPLAPPLPALHTYASARPAREAVHPPSRRCGSRRRTNVHSRRGPSHAHGTLLLLLGCGVSSPLAPLPPCPCFRMPAHCRWGRRAPILRGAACRQAATRRERGLRRQGVGPLLFPSGQERGVVWVTCPPPAPDRPARFHHEHALIISPTLRAHRTALPSAGAAGALPSTAAPPPPIPPPPPLGLSARFGLSRPCATDAPPNMDPSRTE